MFFNEILFPAFHGY